MALDKDFQALDDYLDNKLSADQHKAFDEKLNQDPQLKSELDFQQSIRDGLIQARIAELKGMLNNIPVSSIPTQHSSLLYKIGTWVVVTGLVGTAAYYFLSSQTEAELVEHQPIPQEEVQPILPQESESIVEETIIIPEESKTTNKKADTKRKTASPVETPKRPLAMDVYNPSSEAKTEVEKYELEQLAIISKAFVTSSIEVETNTLDKKYNFHYMFKENKLLLFGTFDKNLYEILEFIGDNKRTVVLYYKSTYYLLDINKSEPTQLEPIKNKKLLQKLKQHRGN